MDGKRGARAQGTDGGDFTFRQKVDKRYELMASAKSFIATTGLITLCVGIYTAAAFFFDNKAMGVDFGPLYALGFAFVSLVVYLLSTKISQKVVDSGMVTLHSLLCKVCEIMSAINVIGVLVELAVYQNFKENIMLYPAIFVYGFFYLISKRAQTADSEIVTLLDTKTKAK